MHLRGTKGLISIERGIHQCSKPVLLRESLDLYEDSIERTRRRKNNLLTYCSIVYSMIQRGYDLKGFGLAVGRYFHRLFI